MREFKIAADDGNLAVALALARAGLPVFPAQLTFNEKKQKWEKKPHIEGWQTEATCDEAKLRAWWHAWPDDAPAIELGSAGLVVIDADRHGGPDGVAAFAALVEQHVQLPVHPVANTAGDGQHHYFKQWNGETFGNSEGLLSRKGINVRGKGGFVVAPGSLRPDGKRWAPAGLSKAYHEKTIPTLPDWIAAMIRPPKKAEAPPAKASNGKQEPAPAPSDLEEARVQAALARIPSEDRTIWFEVGAALHSTGWPQARALWDAWSQTTPSAFDAEGQDRTWQSYDRPYGGARKTIASVFHLAQANGGASQSKQEQPKASAALSEGKRDDITFNAPEPEVLPRQLIQSSAQFVQDFVPPDYLIDGLLQRRFLYSFTGKTGSGKTAVVLLCAACIALGKKIGTLEVTQGRVLYFAGENADDVRMRWIAMAQQMDFDVDTIAVSFIPGRFKISQMHARILQEVREIGELVLVVIDTSAAYFEGDEPNNNAQQGVHAQMLRTLISLPGGPCVLANCHPVKNAAPDNLIPYGGGAFLNEVDGNLTCAIDNAAVEVHWQGKFRGPDFAPLTFTVRTVTHQLLKDSKGRLIPTVVAEHLSEAGQQEMANVARSNEDKLLAEIDRGGKTSVADLAKACGWFTKTGEPYKTLAWRTLDRLKKDKLIAAEREGFSVTEKGKKALSKTVSVVETIPHNPS